MINRADHPPSPAALALAWGVHVYTALGLVCGLYTLRAMVAGDAAAAFRWMLVALFIDSTDGFFARRFHVKTVVPHYDGRKLDDITDYLNYVFLPMFFAVRFGLVPAGVEWVLTLPLLASAYGFCSIAAKTDDGYFTGFPSYWNVVIFYLYILGVPALWSAVLLAYLAMMVFVPIRYIYPSQTKRFRVLNVGGCIAWFLAVIVMMADVSHARPALAWGSLAYPFYYLGISFYLHAVDRPAVAAAPAQ